MGHTGFEHIDPSGPDGFDSDPDFSGGGAGSGGNLQWEDHSGNTNAQIGENQGIDFGPAIGAGIGSALSFGASVWSGKENAKLAKSNQKFQEEMSKTQYQRAVVDMRLAGLNPMLAYQQGGAGNLPGSMGQVPDAGAAVGSGGQAGAAVSGKMMEAKRQRSQIALLDAGSRASNAQAVKAQNEAKVVALQIPKLQGLNAWYGSPQGQKWLHDHARNEIGVGIGTNAAGEWAPKVLQGFKEYVIEGLAPGPETKKKYGVGGPGIGHPDYNQYKWDNRKKQ